MPKIIQINGKVMIKREQRLLAGSAERSNFTESKVNLIKNHVKIKTVSHFPWLRSFRLAWGLDGIISVINGADPPYRQARSTFNES